MHPEAAHSPVGLFLTLVLSALTCTLPRKHALVPLFVVCCFIPVGEGPVIFGTHFHAFRLVLVAGMVRVFYRGEARHLRLLEMDRLFIIWTVVSLVFGTLVKPSFGLFVSRFGVACNAVGAYYLTRCLIREWSDIVRSVRVLLILSVPLALSMLLEKSGHNPMALLGGISSQPTQRDGKFRCQGAFQHPILAGSFGAALFPFAVGLYFYQRRYRRVAVYGAVSSTLIILTSVSSGALLAWVGAVCGIACWRIRKGMRTLRWTILVSIVGLAIVMKAPVWYLIARISELVGGSGWHRSYLIDTAIRHLNEWWLFGTTYTANWGPGGEVILANPNMMDITSQYIQEGVDGGLLKMILFIWFIVKGFKIVGRRVKDLEGKSFPLGFFVWSFGVVLFTHSVSFMSIPYFDQSIIFWYWLLAVLAFIQSRDFPTSNVSNGVSVPFGQVVPARKMSRSPENALSRLVP